MNKFLTGAIATAAGVALLMGGAGTFAYWNSSATPTTSTITAGNLAVTDAGSSTAVWKSGNTVINPANFKAAPGDVLTYTKTMNITATGDNLVATLGLGAGSITGATSGAADQALAAALTQSATLSASGTGIAPVVGSPNTYTVTAGTAGVSQSVTVTATITFPKGTAGQYNDAKTGAVNFSGLAVTLTQN